MIIWRYEMQYSEACLRVVLSDTIFLVVSFFSDWQRMSGQHATAKSGLRPVNKRRRKMCRHGLWPQIIRFHRVFGCDLWIRGMDSYLIVEALRSFLNGTNPKMVNIITGKTPHEEVNSNTRTYDSVVPPDTLVSLRACERCCVCESTRRVEERSTLYRIYIHLSSSTVL